MFYALAILLLVLNAVWLALVVIGLPGTWLILISTALFAWWQHEVQPAGVVTMWTLIAMLALAVIGEILEFAAGMAGSRKAGGSKRGAVGALVGGIIGGIAATFLIPVPFFGSLIGACAGAFLGALGGDLWAGRGFDASVRSGIGAGKGRLLGTVAKFGVGVALWLIAAVAVFWP